MHLGFWRRQQTARLQTKGFYSTSVNPNMRLQRNMCRRLLSHLTDLSPRTDWAQDTACYLKHDKAN